MRAVIPAGGFGTRMLPATKSMPKEMLPVVDRPAIQWVVEEAAAAGCEEIVIVTGRHKRTIEDHFDAAPELEARLEADGRHELLDRVRDTSHGARLLYVRQDQAKGLGHAVLQAEPVVRGEPFALLLGDDIIQGDQPVTEQLMQVHRQTGHSVIGVQRVPHDQVSRYGIVQTDAMEGGLHRVTAIVEKPAPKDAPSDLAVIGRYVLTPAVMKRLAGVGRGVGGEIQLTDAIQAALADEPVYCLEFRGRRFDIGSFAGWREANASLLDLEH